MNVDVNLLRGAALILLIIGFIGLWIWAWSRKRKPEFDQASRMPLEDDITPLSNSNRVKE